MTGPYTLAVDAMGGDKAPDMVVHGLDFAAERHPSARFLLIGDETRLNALLAKHKRARTACTVRHASEVITSEMKPTAALRSLKGVRALLLIVITNFLIFTILEGTKQQFYLVHVLPLKCCVTGCGK